MESTELDRSEEMKLLKERADLLGIKYSNNIGLKSLKNLLFNKKIKRIRLIQELKLELSNSSLFVFVLL